MSSQQPHACDFRQNRLLAALPDAQVAALALSPSRAVVQSPGKGYRLRARAVTEEFTRGGAVLRMVCGYTQALMVQVAQTAVCNRHHTIEQQLCRRLLVESDRLTSDRLMMTHEQLAQLQGQAHLQHAVGRFPHRILQVPQGGQGLELLRACPRSQLQVVVRSR